MLPTSPSSTPAPQNDARLLADRIATWSTATEGTFVHASGAIVLTRGSFAAYEGPLERGPWVRIGLSIGPTGRLRQRADGLTMDALWAHGTVCITPPDLSGECAAAPFRVLGLAMNVPYLRQLGWKTPSADHLLSCARTPHRDPLTAAVLHALWETSKVYGTHSTFIHDGAQLVLDRLQVLCGHRKRRPAEPHPLSRRQVERVRDWLDSRIATDVSVEQMACLTGRSPSAFSRAFAQATGSTPYAYLIRRRIELACTLLLRGVSVTETALLVGYSNPSKFAATFRKATGITPRRWVMGSR